MEYYDGIFLGLLVFLWLLSSRKDENLYFKNFLNKCWIIFDSILFMIYSSDSKGIGPRDNQDTEIIKNFKHDEIATKRIIFIRHGESDWNNCFNKGFNLSFPSRLISAIIAELKLLFTLDSVFIDSPLNEDGIKQALELRNFLQTYDVSKNLKDGISEIVPSIRGDEGTCSVICSSTLRRAVSTTIISLWPRIEANPGTKVYILSSLQEISRNVDTRALSGVNSLADLPFHRIASSCNGISLDNFDTTENFGNKQRNFYDWSFKKEEPTVIVGGHSLWFKAFFNTFLPESSTHDARKKKIVNSGVVSFTLQHAVDDKGHSLYAIDPNSIVVVYGGFEGGATKT